MDAARAVTAVLAGSDHAASDRAARARSRRGLPAPLAAAIAGLGLLLAGACGDVEFVRTGKKLVVVGIDGMDPDLLREYMAKGVMPNFAKLAQEGTFVPLGTSNPPQSPVAWSNFITGMDPGGHGVFDFLHRDPKTYAPVSSTATTDGEPFTIPLPGKYQIEIPPSAEPVRKGVPFWDLLAERGVRADVYRIPAAYPIQESPQLTLSDMGTPDLQGGIDGVYTWYTSDIPDNIGSVRAGKHVRVKVRDGRAETELIGPPTPYLEPDEGKHGPPLTACPLTIYVDPDEPVLHLEIEGGDQCIVAEGEWSPWLRCSFDQGLLQAMSGMVKFYVQQVRPDLRLYASPVNIDPRDPCMPIATPDDESLEEMCESIGPFYTAGLAEETKALEEGVFDDREFLVQCDDITDERLRMLDHALARFEDGLLFFYFSAIDLRCHMMWRHVEPEHPAHDATLAESFGGSIEAAYVQMDRALGRVRERIGAETPIVVLSDHGFSPYLRKVELNQWLYEQGYLVPTAKALESFEQAKADAAADEARQLREHPGRKPSVATPRVDLSISNAADIDRSKTRAYAIGFNSIYLNLKGREADGVVEPGDAARLAEEIRGKLLALTDPERGGAKVVRRVDLRDETYHGSQLENAPDLVVGYDRGYGASDDAALGALTLSTRAKVVTDNKSRWSGNHLMAPEVVPGVFLTNRKLAPQDPGLVDVTATMLAFFGVPAPAEMRGKSLF